MKTLDLFYLSPNPYGGWVTFTAHLMRALRSVGVTPNLYKIRPRSEKKKRPFGYGERYTNINLERALSKGDKPRLIVAAAKNYKNETAELLNAGARLVLHDPTEFKNLPDNLSQERVIVIRKAALSHVPGATFIPHPYERLSVSDTVHRLGHRYRAVSTSRVDFDKHTEIILAANRLLPDDMKVRIHGFENRLYTRFKICPQFPEWEQSKAHYPRDMDAAFNLLSDADMMVDMSIIKGDGGGTQYTTLEAWDAGAVPIIHKDWILPNSEMVPQENCYAVGTPEELADLILEMPKDRLQAARRCGEQSLEGHSPNVIGASYVSFLNL